MKVKLPNGLSSVVLPEIGKAIADENGLIEVSDTIGNSLVKNLGWKEVREIEDAKIVDEESDEGGNEIEEAQEDETSEESEKVDEMDSEKIIEEEEIEVGFDEVSLKKLKVQELIDVANAAGITDEVISKAIGPKKNRKVDLVKIILDTVK